MAKLLSTVSSQELAEEGLSPGGRQTRCQWIRYLDVAVAGAGR